MFNHIYYNNGFQIKSIILNNSNIGRGKWCVVQKWENYDSIKHFLLFIKNIKDLPANVSLIYINDDREYARQALQILSVHWYNEIHSDEITLEKGDLEQGYYLLQILEEVPCVNVTYKFAHSSDLHKQYSLNAVEHSVYGAVFEVLEKSTSLPTKQFAHILSKEKCDFMVLPHLMDINTHSSSVLNIKSDCSLGCERPTSCPQDAEMVDQTNIYYSDAIKMEDELNLKNSTMVFNDPKAGEKLLHTLCNEIQDLFGIYENDSLCDIQLCKLKLILKTMDNTKNPADTIIRTIISITKDISVIMKNPTLETKQDLITNVLRKIKEMIRRIKYVSRIQ